eukprot:TRINITY_DN8761_c0_g1_i1.p1 TRINITY_DN8761_c0_g1~~TRINITY_DN8761_c0_g1_i1.p1  ORF type:complete len:223 (-),score=2.33 TRINITY_DN8761_c0_g1_i1:75-743(-)
MNVFCQLKVLNLDYPLRGPNQTSIILQKYAKKFNLDSFYLDSLKNSQLKWPKLKIFWIGLSDSIIYYTNGKIIIIVIQFHMCLQIFNKGMQSNLILSSQNSQQCMNLYLNQFDNEDFLFCSPQNYEVYGKKNLVILRCRLLCCNILLNITCFTFFCLFSCLFNIVLTLVNLEESWRCSLFFTAFVVQWKGNYVIQDDVKLIFYKQFQMRNLLSRFYFVPMMQ